MYINMILEILTTIGLFFINPLLYIGAFFAVYLGYRRVKRERRHFKIRILNGWSEFGQFFKMGVLPGVLISLVILAAGLTVPREFLVVLVVVTAVALLLYMYQLLSPIVLLAVSSLLLMGLAYSGQTIVVGNMTFNGIAYSDGAALTVTIMAGMLLIAEAQLIKSTAATFASPIKEKTKRGMQAVAYFSKNIWLIPLIFIVPGDVIDAYIPWWPQFTLGAEQFSLVLFPVIIGYQQKTRRTLPVYFYPRYSRAIFILAQLVLIGGLASYFMPVIGVETLAIALVIRLALQLYFHWQQKKATYAVARVANGVMIAGVLPNSPAEKMGLRVGEIIRKVNGQEVQTERELYEALQVNAAHCRLEVLNHQQELRLTQHVVHSNDHFRIGLLIAE